MVVGLFVYGGVLGVLCAKHDVFSCVSFDTLRIYDSADV